VIFRRNSRFRAAALLALAGACVLAGATAPLAGTCGPFTDAAADAFCPFILEIFYLGVTTGTTPATFDPTANVSRLQMAAFLSRTVDGALRRGSTRAALDQFWTTKNATALGLTTVGSEPHLLASDGADIWVANNASDTVSRVRASDGRQLETWTVGGAEGVLVAMGKVFVTGDFQSVYRIDPTQAPGAATAVTSSLAGNGEQLAFDGGRIWVAESGAVSIVTPGASIPWTTTNVTSGFSVPRGVVFDGSNVWAVDAVANKIFKLDASGAILQTVTVGAQSTYPAFDGSSLWVPSEVGSSVSVVRASTGVLLATLTGNGLSFPVAAAFDGQRILITNNANSSVSLFKAADLTPLGTFPTGTGTQPWGACSDGVHFWIALSNASQLARF
jgi:hypothetical protein